jgi:uncharacterized membrane protein
MKNEMSGLSELLNKPIRVVFYELAVVNFIRIGMWQGVGYNPLSVILNTIDKAFASSPIFPATNLAGIYSTIHVLSIIISIILVFALGDKWWGVVTVILSFLAGVSIGAAFIPGVVIFVPMSMLLGVYAPLVEKTGSSPQYAPPVR